MKLQACRIGFVGGGNMAEALIRGLLESGAAAGAQIRASDPAADRRERLGERYGIDTGGDNAALASWAELLVLAVKPTVVPAALEALASTLGDTLLVSIAAGVTTRSIEARLSKGARVVRAMPNTAAISLAAATALAPGRHADDGDVALATALFDAVGRTVVVAEDALDAVTGLSGSGPGYVMLFIEALADGGVRAGLAPEVALLLAAQTVYGAAKLQLEGGEHPATLRDRVTSEGGTTLAGLDELEAAGVRRAIIAAVQAATRRSRELGG